MATNGAEGVYLASQGRTAMDVLQELEHLRAEIAQKDAIIERYKALYGDLDDPTNVQDFLARNLDM